MKMTGKQNMDFQLKYKTPYISTLCNIYYTTVSNMTYMKEGIIVQCYTDSIHVRIRTIWNPTKELYANFLLIDQYFCLRLHLEVILDSGTWTVKECRKSQAFDLGCSWGCIKDQDSLWLHLTMSLWQSRPPLRASLMQTKKEKNKKAISTRHSCSC